MGYALPNQITAGIHTRLHSRAFVIDDNVKRIAFVTVDCGMIGHIVKLKVTSTYDDGQSSSCPGLSFPLGGGTINLKIWRFVLRPKRHAERDAHPFRSSWIPPVRHLRHHQQRLDPAILRQLSGRNRFG